MSDSLSDNWESMKLLVTESQSPFFSHLDGSVPSHIKHYDVIIGNPTMEVIIKLVKVIISSTCLLNRRGTDSAIL